MFNLFASEPKTGRLACHSRFLIGSLVAIAITCGLAEVADAANVSASISTPQLPLENIAQPLRLAGEESELRWPVYLTEEQARAPLHFRVGYIAAISVMPEASSLTISINDSVITKTPINAPGAVKIIEFEIPEGILKAGYNAVAITGVQRHRVDCSIEATYELWTQIDPSWTGFVVPAAIAGVERLDDLPAIPPNNQGLIPIQVILGRKPNVESMERIIRAAQQIAIAGQFSQAVVEFAPVLRNSSGLNLLIGTPDELAAIPSAAALINDGDSSVTFLPANAQRAATIIFKAETGAELDAAIASFKHQDRGTGLIGSPQGIRLAELAKGKRVSGGETLQLADLGSLNQEFTGRLFRSGFDLNLPLDFLPADYANINLSLAGGYAPGLEPGAEIIVDINGRNAASVPLPKYSGDFFRDEQIALPLGLWRPGRNHVDISALLPIAADQTCDTAVQSEEHKRFLLLSSTSVRFPQFGRALRIPDLAVATNGALPYALAGIHPLLVVPTLDKDTLAAAATVAVQMGLAANHVIDFELSLDGRSEKPRPKLIVSPARALNPSMLKSIGIDPAKVQQVWQGRADPPPAATPNDLVHTALKRDGMSLDRLRNNIPAACALPAQVARAAPITIGRVKSAQSNSSREAPDQDIQMSWERNLNGSVSLRSRASATATYISGLFNSSFEDSVNWVQSQFAEAPVEVDPRASLIMGQSMTGEGVDSIMTLITAPNAELLKASVTCLTTPSVWSQLQGRVAFLNADDGSVSTYSPNRSQVLETEPRSFANLRLVFAGWLSLNPTIFVLVILTAAVGLGLSTNAMLRNIGRENAGRSKTNGKKSDNGGSHL